MQHQRKAGAAIIMRHWLAGLATRTVLSVACLQGSDPDIAEAHGVAVILQDQRPGWWMLHIAGRDLVLGWAEKGQMNLDRHTIVDHRDSSWSHHLAGREAWRLPQDIEDVPFTRLAAGIHQGWLLTIEGTCQAIGVRWIIIIIST